MGLSQTATTATARDCHALLEVVLDAIEERSGNGWALLADDLGDLARSVTTYPTERWTARGTLFATEIHHQLDMALRCDAAARENALASVRAALTAKATHQDWLAGASVLLAEEVRRWVNERGAALDPDTADPIASLHDALIYFHPRFAKIMLRELLRPDQYAFQRVRTAGNPVLVRIAEYLDGPDFAAWKLDTGPATCGAVAHGHPERNTWYLEDGEY
jgi:hypothetical protein